jgi:predicted nucleic acid-binding protein
MLKGALLDTSFLIRLLLPAEALHIHARDYYKYFLEQLIPLFISTVSIAEYCVQGTLQELPLQQVQVLPFNMKDAENASQLMNILLNHKGVIQALGRKVVINDVKLYAQANVSARIDAFVTADSEGRKMYNAIHAQQPSFQLY